MTDQQKEGLQNDLSVAQAQLGLLDAQYKQNTYRINAQISQIQSLLAVNPVVQPVNVVAPSA